MGIKTIHLDNGVKVECHYEHEKADPSIGIFTSDVTITNVYYKGVDVTALINEIDVNCFYDWEEKIKEEIWDLDETPKS